MPWPDPLNDEALYGLAGDVVRAVAPYTEADPAAILGHFLCGAGVLLGMETYAVVGDAQHPPKLNVLVIGPTSKGRKGTAQRATERVLRAGRWRVRREHRRGPVERRGADLAGA